MRSPGGSFEHNKPLDQLLRFPGISPWGGQWRMRSGSNNACRCWRTDGENGKRRDLSRVTAENGSSRTCRRRQRTHNKADDTRTHYLDVTQHDSSVIEISVRQKLHANDQWLNVLRGCNGIVGAKTLSAF